MLSLSDSVFISFFILLSNEPLESGNNSWAVYGSAIISGNVHLFILTGTISPEGVYCRFLFPKCWQMPLLSVMLTDTRILWPGFLHIPS